MKALAITDHHNVFSWFKMIEAERKYGVKPIFGSELNVGNHHITALAMNEKGVRNIWMLNNIGHQKKARPKITERELKQYAEGIYFLSGCSKGKVPSLLAEREFKKLLDTVEEYKNTFHQNFALEIQNHGRSYNQAVMRTFISLGVKKKIDIIPTNDCHYLNKEDHLFHSRLLSMHTQGKIKQNNTQNYFKTTEEMKEKFPEFMLEQTKEIEKKCEVNLFDMLKNQVGNNEIPLSMLYYYDDASALQKALYSNKQYKLGSYLYKKMKKEDLLLEDIYPSEEIKEELSFAYGLRGKLFQIEPDPNYYIKTDETFPIYRTSKDKEVSAQIDILTAKSLDIPIYDRRKIVI